MTLSANPHCAGDMAWPEWVPTIRATLCFVVRDGEVLLIRKKRGLGAGKINGPGGKIDAGETAMESAIRETFEELRVTPKGVREAGELFFEFRDGMRLYGVVFIASDIDGEAQETEEAVPLWTPLDRIPYDEMWADDRHWLPIALRGDRFRACFEFDGDVLRRRRVELI